MEFNATFFVSGISFIIFAIVMNIVMYNPLAKVVEQRKKYIDGNYEDADNANQKATSLIKDRAEKIAKANSDARKVIVDITDEAKLKKAEECANAKNAANDEINCKKAELKNASVAVSNELKQHVRGIAETISSKILGENSTISEVDEEVINNIMQEG